MCACALGEEMCVSDPFSPVPPIKAVRAAIPCTLPAAPAADGCFAVFQGPYDALGVSIAGGKGSPLGDIPIFIAMIQASGVAARTQRLRVSTGALLFPNTS